jgi:superfamily II DNA helicase RecQ
MLISLIIIWGDNIRTAFAQLGELRSLLPSHVNLMGLTATATKESYDIICSRLSLKVPVLVGAFPNRSNIYYIVKEMPTLDIFCSEIADDLKRKGLEYPKTIVFC